MGDAVASRWAKILNRLPWSQCSPRLLFYGLTFGTLGDMCQGTVRTQVRRITANFRTGQAIPVGIGRRTIGNIGKPVTLLKPRTKSGMVTDP